MSTLVLMRPIFFPFEHVWEGEPFKCGWCQRPLKRGDSVTSQATRSGCLVYTVCERCYRAERYGERP